MENFRQDEDIIERVFHGQNDEEKSELGGKDEKKHLKMEKNSV